MWVYHPPLTTGIPACWLSLLRRVRFIYEIQDMWPETLAATGMMRSRVALSLLGKLAKFVYSRAAGIVVISPGFKRNLISKGVPEEKIHVIPNGVDEAVFRPVRSDREWARGHGITGSFVVVFAGNVGLAQGLDTVLEAAEMMLDVSDIQFVLIGDGVEEPRLRRRAEERGLRNVRFLGRRPTEEMPRFFALADVLLVHLRRDPLFEITIPSKTLAYLACGRPILMAAAGDAADVVREAGAGLVCPPQDPVALAHAVRTLYTMPKDEREHMGREGRRAFLAKYATRSLVDQYEVLLRDVARR
jgi:glycosyltransferase involved in cell wall biosynthesis